MKIKNLKINKKSTSKLPADILLVTLTIVGSSAAVILIGTSAAMLGIEAVTIMEGVKNISKKTSKNVDRNNFLKGTTLENVCVVTFKDDSKDIAVAINSGFFDVCPAHYYSIVSGEYFADENCGVEEIEGVVAQHYEIVKDENIINYLTSDEIIKLKQDDLTNDDINNIINRIINPATMKMSEKNESTTEKQEPIQKNMSKQKKLSYQKKI